MDPYKQQYLDAMGIPVWERSDAPSALSASPAATSETVQAASAPVEELDETVVNVDDQAPTASLSALDWPALQSHVAACTACELCHGRTQTVFGVGDPQADVLFVGEAPGAQEDLKGEPFVGRAGKLLNSMLFSIGLERSQIFIANILKCRPPENRDPTPEEVALCTPFLERQIALMQPKVVVALGRIAAHYLLKTNTALGKLRNQTWTFGESQVPLLVTYHPAYLLRSPREKRKAYQDMLTIQKMIQPL